MHVRLLTVNDYRSYAAAELPLAPGVTVLVGLNGQGKTNLVEALGYVATLASHRVATDAPLVRVGADRAVVRAVVVRDGRESIVELEITPGRANKARLGRSPVARPRDVLGTLRTVLFAPEDLALVKGDPSERRRFVDDLLVARQPRWAAVRSDVDKILKQRGALLRSAAPSLRGGRRSRRAPQGVDAVSEGESALHTLDVWDGQLARAAAPLLYARLRLLRDLRPHLESAYREVSAGQSDVGVTYRSSLRDQAATRIAAGDVLEIDELHDELLTSLAESRTADIERAVNLVGPHRDDLVLTLGPVPAKGYASHGESWSFALALKLAAYQLLRHDLHDDPVLILDDVFAELDAGRRGRLAELVADCEQVIITAAVGEDVPQPLQRTGSVHAVRLGEILLDAGRPEPLGDNESRSGSADRTDDGVAEPEVADR